MSNDLTFEMLVPETLLNWSRRALDAEAKIKHMDELVEAAKVLVADSRWVSGEPNFERFRTILAKIKGKQS